MKKVLIISGGEYSPVNDNTSYDYVIACDKGAEYASKMGIKPDLIMGDFDSFSGEPGSCFEGILVERFPVMKDDTDTMLAIKKAFSMGYKHMVIACALGGRLDHLISNIQSLAYIAVNGGTGEIISEKEHMRTLTASEGILAIPRQEGRSLSVYSLSDKCAGLTIKGALYEVEGVELTNSFPLGHGNSITEEKAEISIESGVVLIVESTLEPGAHS